MDDPEHSPHSSPLSRFLLKVDEVFKSMNAVVVSGTVLIVAVGALIANSAGLFGPSELDQTGGNESPEPVLPNPDDGNGVSDPILPGPSVQPVATPVLTRVEQVWSDQRIWASRFVEINDTETTVLVTSIEGDECSIAVGNPGVENESYTLSVGDVEPIRSEFETRITLNRISRTFGAGPKRCHFALERDVPVQE